MRERDYPAEWASRSQRETPEQLEKRRRGDRTRARRYRERVRLARSIPLHAAFLMLATTPWMLGGCALLPDSIGPEVQHVSSLDNRCCDRDGPFWGGEQIGGSVRWERGNFRGEVGEYYEVYGPSKPRPDWISPHREMFEARASWQIPLR